MKASIKRIDKSLKEPAVKDGVLSLVCRRDVIINSKETRSVPLNLIVKPIAGYIFVVTPGEILEKKNLSASSRIVNSLSDGGEELNLAVYNLSDERAIILKGEVTAYGFFIKAEKITVHEGK